jgi:hypothetical protein
MKRLQSVDQVINAFGGAKTAAANNKAVAAWLGLNTSAVCNWRERNSIPSGWHLRFYLEANKRGMEIEPCVFGLECELPSTAKKKRRGARTKSGVEYQAA